MKLTPLNFYIFSLTLLLLIYGCSKNNIDPNTNTEKDRELLQNGWWYATSYSKTGFKDGIALAPADTALRQKFRSIDLYFIATMHGDSIFGSAGMNNEISIKGSFQVTKDIPYSVKLLFTPASDLPDHLNAGMKLDRQKNQLTLSGGQKQDYLVQGQMADSSYTEIVLTRIEFLF